MIQTFQCPNCRAALDYETETHNFTMKCAYCNSSIIIPENLRREGKVKPVSAHAYQEQSQQLTEVMRLVNSGQKIQAIKLFQETFKVGLKEAKDIVDGIERNEAVHLGGFSASANAAPFVVSQTNEQPRSVARVVGCFLLILIVTVGVGMAFPLLIGGAATWWGIQEVERAFEGAEVNPLPALNIEQTIEASLGPLQGLMATPTPEMTAEPGMLTEVLRFGSEGLGPGLFDDTRGIGVDNEGNIYTGDYSNGRVQMFDANGRYLTEWNAGADLYMQQMVVDGQGIFYTIYRNELIRFTAKTGEPLPPLALPAGVAPQGLAAMPGGGVLVYAPGRLIWYDANGALSREATNLPEFRLGSTYQNMVVSAAEEIYISGSDAVLRFNEQGQFLNQIAPRGEGLDQMPRQPTGMAVDSADRLFLLPTSSEIWVFDRNGRHLETVSLRTMGFYMTINNQDQLLIMNRNAAQVEIYEIAP